MTTAPTGFNRGFLMRLLREHEGVRDKPYDDQTGKPLASGDALKGKLTIGVGRNLTDVGLSNDEIDYLLENDIARVEAELDEALPWWRNLDPVRQLVMMDLGFNLGVLTPPGEAKLLTFTTTLALIRNYRFEDAAANLAKTKWATQVGHRATKLIWWLKSGTATSAPHQV